MTHYRVIQIGTVYRAQWRRWWTFGLWVSYMRSDVEPDFPEHAMALLRIKHERENDNRYKGTVKVLQTWD